MLNFEISVHNYRDPSLRSFESSNSWSWYLPGSWKYRTNINIDLNLSSGELSGLITSWNTHIKVHPCTKESQGSRDFSICWSPRRYSLCVEEALSFVQQILLNAFCMLGTHFQAGDPAPRTLFNLNASVREYPDQASISDLSTLKIMYLFVFFILLSYTTLFREEFIFRAVILLGSTCLWDIWHSFLCPLQDKFCFFSKHIFMGQ